MDIKNYIALLFILLTVGCSKSNEYAAADYLDDTGFPGRWEIQDRYNPGAVQDLLPSPCCEYLEFRVDDNANDFIGIVDFESNDPVFAPSFTAPFELDIDKQSLIIYKDSGERFFQFAIEEKNESIFLKLTYAIGSQDWEEVWIKRE